ncbi:MAG TPA: histidine kinase [Gemmatimonadaceae bacterium]|nr:histidine kinase [Gemmatimonadaceae bacterium]
MRRWPRPRVWLIIAAASIVPAVLDAGQAWLKETLDDAPGVNWSTVTFQGVEWLFLGALTPIAWVLSRRFPLDRARWKRTLAAHAAGALALCIGWATLGIALGLLLDTWVAQGRLGPAYFNWLLTSVPWSVFMYFTVLGCVYAFTYFNEARERETQASHLAAQLAEARLGALRSQLHPHFLFNSLNAVTVFVREQDTRSASRMLELLGDMLRQLLRPDRPHEVPLSDELAFAEQYLAIEQVRFSDRLRVEWSIDERARAALVPDLLLQPLVENAIRHGVARRADAGLVVISARVEANVLRLSVRDDGAGIDERGAAEEPGRGVGLSNTRERLRALYGESATLTLETPPGGGTEVVITLPFRTAAR